MQTFPLLEVQLKLIGSDEKEDWQALGISAFEADWDNPEDAIYDDWRKHYGVEQGPTKSPRQSWAPLLKKEIN
ncbi:MAG: hypothetical protein ACPGWR_21220 [Ardenticatenaceae bacterium]